MTGIEMTDEEIEAVSRAIYEGIEGISVWDAMRVARAVIAGYEAAKKKDARWLTKSR